MGLAGVLEWPIALGVGVGYAVLRNPPPGAETPNAKGATPEPSEPEPSEPRPGSRPSPGGQPPQPHPGPVSPP